MSATESHHFHVVFEHTARGVLAEALRIAARDEVILEFPDDLSVGPIDGDDAQARVDEILRQFGPDLSHYSNLPSALEAFWAAFRAARTVPVIWFSRSCVPEYLGFLAVARILGDGPYQIMDLSGTSEVKRRHEWPAALKVFRSIAEMRAADVAALLSSIQVPSRDQRDHHQQVWSRLRKENAPLRVLTDGGIASAPLSFFDEALLTAVPAHWQTIARTIGEIYGRSFEDLAMQANQSVLHSRIRALVTNGALEGRGDFADMRAGEVRRSTVVA